jgi:hypothetical protein
MMYEDLIFSTSWEDLSFHGVNVLTVCISEIIHFFIEGQIKCFHVCL